MSKYFLEDTDLLDVFDYLHEFEAEGSPEEDDEEDEDFSMDDEGGEETTSEPEEISAENNEGESELTTEDEEDEDFSMDDEGGEETENQEDTEAEEPPVEDEEEDFEIPDDEEDQEGEETPSEEDEEDDFSMDDEGGEEGEETPTDDEPTDDSSEDPETNTKLKELESVIFDDLSEDEKNMKITELKALYITVYKKCGSIYEMLVGIKKDEETIQIVEYISNTLIDLKEYVNDYINKVFDSKTYIENLSQLQKYIMIFNTINKVFEQIRSENE